MTNATTDPDPDDPDMLAGEYVLGTLTPAERARADRRLEVDPDFRIAVADWEQRLSRLDDGAQSVAPDPSVWPKIDRRIDRHSTPGPDRPLAGDRTADTIPEQISDLTPARNGGADIVDFAARARLWKRATFVSSALAACLAVFLIPGVSTFFRGPPPQNFIAAVNRGGTLPALIVSVNTELGQVTVRSVAAETPEQRDLEIWHVRPDTTPVSLGLLRQDVPITRLVSRSKVSFDAQDAIAVSVELPGGSTTGLPTGPIIYSGQLIAQE